MKLKRSLGVASIVLCAMASMASAAPDTVFATVGSVKITEKDLSSALASLPAQQRAYYDNAEGRNAILEELVTFNILAMAGSEQKLENTEPYKMAIKNYGRQLLANLAAEKATQNVAPVTDQAVRSYYDEHKSTFVTPEAVRASHILIELPKNADEKTVKAAREKAMSYIKQLSSKKVSFEELAKDNSSCPSKTQGGDLGFFTKEQMVPEFANAAFAMKKGEISKEPVRSNFGFHVIQVTDRRPAVERPFNEVKDDIKADLERQGRVDAFSKYVDSLKAKYKVTMSAAPGAPEKK